MSAIAPDTAAGVPTPNWTVRPTAARFHREEQPSDLSAPNTLVRWAFYLSVFAIPFVRLYLPGTGERVGVTRLVQALIICAVLSQPRVCLRLFPIALLWMLAYCGARILAGLWMTPELSELWWPSTFELLQFSLPWVWMMFNVLHFPRMRRGGFWALAWGCSLCALFHVVGIGVQEVDKGLEGRSSIFGENANVVGSNYAIAVIVLIGLGMLRDVKFSHRLLVLPLIVLVGLGLAKTGSRTAGLILALGIAVLFFLGSSFGSRTKRLASLILIGGVLAGVMCLVPTVMKRFENLNAGSLDRQEGRVRMIPVLWEMFLRSPIYGSGPDGYQFELTRRSMPHLIREQRTIASHNLVLLLLVETGLIGFLLFSCGLKAALIAAWRARRMRTGPLPLAVLLPLVIAGACVSEPSHHLIFWFAMAYALAGTV